MPEKINTTLAIDPGTRYLGLAVLDGGALIHHGVKTISVELSPHDRLVAGRTIVVRLIRDFRPSVLAVEQAFFAQNRNTALLNVLVDEIADVRRRAALCRQVDLAGVGEAVGANVEDQGGQLLERFLARIAGWAPCPSI